jgi:uncharacterized protein (DUF2235 family)
MDPPNDTNVRKLYLLLNDDSQLKYYDSGVGTDGSAFEHFFGGAMGEGLFQKIQDGYAFLSYVWDPGDEIYIFGFSRGAYTARSLAGMIALFGVPTKNLDNQTVKRVFDAYRITDHDQRKAAKASLAEEYGLTDVDVRMAGVWDTVGALGIPGHLFGAFDQAKYGFLDTTLSNYVKSAYHAISIDERRSSFIPTLWTNADGSPALTMHSYSRSGFQVFTAMWAAATRSVNSRTLPCVGCSITPKRVGLSLTRRPLTLVSPRNRSRPWAPPMTNGGDSMGFA